MPIFVGTSNKNREQISIGAQQMGGVYIGDKLVWQKTKPFIFTVAVTAGLSISLPLLSGSYSYACSVNWGDGSAATNVIAYNSAGASHTYASTGTYDIKIYGTCQSFSVNNGSIKSYINQVKKWGNCDFRKLDFSGCSNLTTLPAGPITGCSNITTFDNFLANCTSYTTTLNENWFTLTPLVTSFGSSFNACNASGAIPENLFRYCPEVLNFGLTFTNARYLTGSIPEKLFRYNTKVTSFAYTFSIGGSVGGSLSGDIPRDLFYYNTEVTTFEWLFRWFWGSLNIPNGLFRNNLKATNFNSAFSRMSYTTMGQYPFSAIDPAIPGDTEAAAAYRRFTGKSPDFSSAFYNDHYHRSNNTRYAPEIWDPTIYNMVGNTHDVNTFKSPANVYTNQASIPTGWK